jgi:hypothetical protein
MKTRNTVLEASYKPLFRVRTNPLLRATGTCTSHQSTYSVLRNRKLVMDAFPWMSSMVGTVAARYIWYGGTVCDFSTGDGDANALLTAAADGYLRLFDFRQPLPVLTFDVGKPEVPLITAVLAHVDGLLGETPL